MRDGDRESCLRVLGLGPGASAGEIKAAYRDLAKVWHPDRFAHDRRLQQKAQEQLKEINAAHARLASGDHANARTHREQSASHASSRASHAADAPRPPRPDASSHDARRESHSEARPDARVAVRPRSKVTRLALAAPALAFCATFALVTPRLLSTARAPEQTRAHAAAAEHAPSPDEQDDAARQQTNPAERAARAQQKTHGSAQLQATQDAESAPVAAAARPSLPTVTVSIDPTTGLRARAACPHKTSMTFPSGDEPRAYCDAAHGNAGRDNAAAASRGATDDARANAAGGSRLKSFAGRVAAPVRNLFGSRRASDKEPADKVADAPRN